MIIRRLLNCWFRKMRTGFYVSAVCLSAGAYFIGAMVRSESGPVAPFLTQAGFAGFLLTALFFFIHLNLHACHWFLDHFRDTDHLPTRQISHVNSFCMTLFLCLCLGAMPAAAWSLEPLWQSLYRWFADFEHPGQIPFPEPDTGTGFSQSPDLSRLLGEPRPTPAWIVIADRIFRVMGYILILLFVVLVCYRLCRQFWTWITRPRFFDSDEKIYLTPTWSLGSDKKKAGPKPAGWFSRSYSEKIRRRYRREILTLSRKKKLTLPPSASPSQLEETAGLNHKVLHRLYEKARYGPEECTRQEWEEIRGPGPR